MELSTSFNTTVRSPPPLHLHRRFPHRLSISICSTHRVSLAESLQEETLKTLEWPSVCNQLAAFTSTSMGLDAARNARIPIGRSSDESRKLLDQTTAALELPPLDFSGIDDVSEIVDVSVSGELLSIREICTVKRTLKSARELFEQLQQISSNSDSLERYTPMLEILQNCNFLMDLEQKIVFCIDCKFLVILDRASEELEIIRSERKSNMESLESLLKQVSSRIYQAGGIDRPLVTRRRSRMCVGVRASHRYLLPGGVVLNVSSSGATYFMEPKEAVELNNMEVRLSNHEKAEEEAIFSMLTSQIAESKAEIKYLLEQILEVDFAVARAAHAQWLSAVCPNPIIKTTDDTDFGGENNFSVNIEGIQHPLLLEISLKASSDFAETKSYDFSNKTLESDSGPSDFPVPIDIKIKCGTRVIVISGPNTGGKTASIKTLGLASVMLKAGMYLPAKNRPSLPWFDLVLADIGDHQSVEQSLSTFSGHLSWLCKILEVASKESLILIDEIGSGTDPSEGVALSASILQYLKDRVNLAVVTTHYADLSLMKEADSRFENAAMEFSLETLQPTYRVIWGSAGESNALSIAKSIGFDADIISRAHAWVERLMPDKMQKRQGLLYQSLMEERCRLQTQAERAASLYKDIMHLYNEIHDEAKDLAQREEMMKANETQKIQIKTKNAISQIQDIVDEFEKQLRNASIDQLNSLLKKSESAVASIVEAHHASQDFLTKGTPASSYMPQLGEKVHVKGLGYKLATVVEIEADEGDGTVLVQYGKMKFRVDISSISPPSDENSTTNSAPHRRKMGQQNRSSRNLLNANITRAVPYGPAIQTSKNTVDLRGMRVDEASRHLKLAIGATESNSVLFIIHGMGTGIIKECTLEILGKHPRVEKFEQETAMNYGCTVAHIK